VKKISRISFFEIFVGMSLFLILLVKGLYETNLFLDGSNYLIQMIEKEFFIFDYPHLRYILGLPEFFTVMSSKFLKTIFEIKDLITIYHYTAPLLSYLLAICLYFSIRRKSKSDAIAYLLVQLCIGNVGNAFVLSGIFESTLIFSAVFFSFKNLNEKSNPLDHLNIFCLGALTLFCYESFYLLYGIFIFQTYHLFRKNQIPKRMLRGYIFLWSILLFLSSLNFYHVINHSIDREAIAFYTHSLYGFFRELHLLSYFAVFVLIVSFIKKDFRKTLLIVGAILLMISYLLTFNARSIMSQSYDVRTIASMLIFIFFLIITLMKKNVDENILKSGIVISLTIQVITAFLVGEHFSTGLDKLNIFRKNQSGCHLITKEEFDTHFNKYFQNEGFLPHLAYLQSINSKDNFKIKTKWKNEFDCL